jgi:hypothetical protein
LVNVAFNGAAALTGLDVFAQVGALKPYTASFPVIVTKTLLIDFSATVGNAVVSGIQVDSADAPAFSSLNSCQSGVGLGGDPPLTGTFSKAYCYNDGGAARAIVAIRCYSDNAGASTLDVASGQTGASFLTAPVICSPSWTSGTLAQSVSLPAGDWLNFTFTPDGATTQTSWVVTEQLGSASPVVLRECKGSGPSWNCAGMLWATIPMSDGSLVQLLGAAMPDFQPTSGTWNERK